MKLRFSLCNLSSALALTLLFTETACDKDDREEILRLTVASERLLVTREV